MIFELHSPSDREVLTTYLAGAREQSKTIGLVSGSFDLLHFHHGLLLARCGRMCDVLIVGVDSDELVRERKGSERPVIYDMRRVTQVDWQKQVSFAFIMRSIEDFGDAAELIRPDSIFKNDAFEGREDEVLGLEYAGRVVIVKDVVDHASTGAIMQAARTVSP
jgi:D-glycero-beta-D-manno-heptose 1-phosphate adenylyltransferase